MQSTTFDGCIWKSNSVFIVADINLVILISGSYYNMSLSAISLYKGLGSIPWT